MTQKTLNHKRRTILHIANTKQMINQQKLEPQIHQAIHSSLQRAVSPSSSSFLVQRTPSQRRNPQDQHSTPPRGPPRTKEEREEPRREREIQPSDDPGSWRTRVPGEPEEGTWCVALEGVGGG